MLLSPWIHIYDFKINMCKWLTLELNAIHSHIIYLLLISLLEIPAKRRKWKILSSHKIVVRFYTQGHGISVFRLPCTPNPFRVSWTLFFANNSKPSATQKIFQKNDTTLGGIKSVWSIGTHQHFHIPTSINKSQIYKMVSNSVDI